MWRRVPRGRGARRGWGIGAPPGCGQRKSPKCASWRGVGDVVTSGEHGPVRVVGPVRRALPAHPLAPHTLVVLTRLRRAEGDAPIVEQRIDLAHGRAGQLL